ncbi:MAG: GtrA family protein [Parcubacteria group bacterium]|nr:GtrA family protein [Parcubacteria group bacterium]
MKFSKKDLLFSLITGFYTGFIAWRILGFLLIPSINGLSFAWLMIFTPFLWILGVNLGYFLGRWFIFFNQFGKFAAIGFTNAAVDFGILNFLIFYSGSAAGILFSVFKGISFVAAAGHSYFWNKFWSFGAGGTEVSGREFFKFFSVVLVAALINVGTASFVVSVVGPQFGLSREAWANIGAIIGSGLALTVSFIGFKKAVFKE